MYFEIINMTCKNSTKRWKVGKSPGYKISLACVSDLTDRYDYDLYDKIIWIV